MQGTSSEAAQLGQGGQVHGFDGIHHGQKRFNRPSNSAPTTKKWKFILGTFPSSWKDISFFGRNL